MKFIKLDLRFVWCKMCAVYNRKFNRPIKPSKQMIIFNCDTYIALPELKRAQKHDIEQKTGVSLSSRNIQIVLNI
jgi:hypothetical protein